MNGRVHRAALSTLRPMRRACLPLLAALAFLVVAAPSASAADVDVINAWGSQNAAFQDATAKLAKAMRKGERTKYRRPAPVIKAIKRFEELTSAVATAVVAQTPSTPSGARAKEEVVKSLAGYVASLRDLRKAIKAVSRKKLKRGNKLLRRSARRGGAAELAQATAIQLFQAGQREAAGQQPGSPGSPGDPSSPGSPSEPTAPCDDKDPNVEGCQDQPPGTPCEDKNPNVAGCQTQPPPPTCTDRDPNVAGCQTQCEADQDPNKDGCQIRCEADQNPNQQGCQTVKPTCAEDPSQAGCPTECQITGTLPQCQEPPPSLRILTRRASALGGLLGFLDPAADELGAVARADL